jgi:hypothetical protein
MRNPVFGQSKPCFKCYVVGLFLGIRNVTYLQTLAAMSDESPKQRTARKILFETVRMRRPPIERHTSKRYLDTTTPRISTLQGLPETDLTLQDAYNEDKQKGQIKK